MKILVYPKDINPYQELLYRPMKHYADIKYLNSPTGSRTLNLFLLPFQIIYNRLLGFSIFHLHWSYLLVLPIKGAFWRIVSTVYFAYILLLIRALGYKLIWTVHNVSPHNQLFFNDLLARKLLAKLSSIKIVHSKFTIGEMKKLGLDVRNSYIIPHGNYIGFYKNNVNQCNAKKYFNFKKNDFIFLFFGRINEYKGIEDLLKVFEKLTKQSKNVQLLIAGKCDDKNLDKILSNYRNKFKDNIKIYSNFIKDNEVQYYFNCADIIVYPFKEITTSGSVLLGLSFGKPIICPRIGALNDLPNDIGYFYNNNDKDELFEAMLKAVQNKENLELLGGNGLNYAKALSWSKIANETIEIYRSLLRQT